MKIIKAETTHFTMVRELFREYQHNVGEDGSSECFDGFEEELESLPGQYQSPKGIIYIAFDNAMTSNENTKESSENAIACVAIKPRANNSRHAEIKRLYVRQNKRSSGVGKQLLITSMQFAQNANYEAMFLETVSSMKAAIGLYEGIGFMPIKPSEQKKSSAVKHYQYNFDKNK